MLNKQRIDFIKRNLVDETNSDILDLIEAVESLTRDMKNIRKHHELCSMLDNKLTIGWPLADRAIKKVWGDDES